MSNVPSLGSVLEKSQADILAQLKPLQDYVAAQTAKPPVPQFSWMENLSKSAQKWAQEPKPGQAIVIHKNGSYQLVPASVVMGAGGLLSAVENPLNSIWSTLPLGSIAAGALTGIVTGEVIDGLFPPSRLASRPNFTNVAVKGGAMVALTMFGPRLMSKTGTVIAVGLLGAAILQDIFPLDKLVNWIVNFFRKLFGRTAVAGNRVTEVGSPDGQFNQQRNDVYAGLFGGG